MNTQKRILIPIDGSTASMEAVLYTSRLSSLFVEKVVLFHVFSPQPDYYWDLGEHRDPILSGKKLEEAIAWNQELKTNIRSILENAKNILTHAGFPETAVEIKIIERQIGFARDIINEARKGYHLAVIGRKGKSNLESTAFGGVTVKLVQKLDFLSIVLVGQSPPPTNALVALDGSTSATKALNTIGAFLVKSGFGVTLFHAIREDRPGEHATTASRRGEEILLSAHMQMPAGPIKTKMVTEKTSRAAAIMEEVTRSGFGTIVLGRKGLSNVQCFYIGRVSNKVAQLADKQAVWIVS